MLSPGEGECDGTTTKLAPSSSRRAVSSSEPIDDDDGGGVGGASSNDAATTTTSMSFVMETSEVAPSGPPSASYAVPAAADADDDDDDNYKDASPTPQLPSHIVDVPARPPTASELLDVTERMFRDADRERVTVRNIIESVARHFNVTKLDRDDRRRIKGRLIDLSSSEGGADEDRVSPATDDGNNDEVGDHRDDSRDVNDDDEDDDSDYVEVISRGTCASSPEVIDLVDDDSDDDDDDRSRSCFWEYDANGNVRRNATCKDSKRRNVDAASLFDDSSDDSSGVEDVTEIALAKRREQARKMVENAEVIHDSDDNDSIDDREQTTKEGKHRTVSSPSTATTNKRRRSKRNAESIIEVIIDERDVPLCPGATIARDDDNDISHDGPAALGTGVDWTIKQRIVKLLNTGFHEESNEHEARNAMRLARRLMERYNLDQALLLQERGDGSLNDFSTANDDDDDNSSLRGGIVTVNIRNRKSGEPTSLHRWCDFLIDTVCMNFRVEAFTTVARGPPRECSVTFYGIRTNAQLAAYAFKITSERCSMMAAAYEPPRKVLSTGKRVVGTRNARLSYALGIVDGLERDVKDGLRREEERRKEKLKRAHDAAKRGEPYHQDDDVSDEEGAAPIKTDDIIDNTNTIAHQLDKLERENTAHLALIDHHKQIASDVLKSKKIKLQSSRKYTSITLNRDAYDRGVIDSKEIDLNQRAIK
ncbi:hypothetical protein ACHAXA_006015 [Cyclostephanos tholiformis]|uniref:DUF2786 domain-containing protein n=1 Tax=Cyclostephanos tholiformis TaxID=382380 RepID=A0ABD3SR71_9STRA